MSTVAAGTRPFHHPALSWGRRHARRGSSPFIPVCRAGQGRRRVGMMRVDHRSRQRMALRGMEAAPWTTSSVSQASWCGSQRKRCYSTSRLSWGSGSASDERSPTCHRSTSSPPSPSVPRSAASERERHRLRRGCRDTRDSPGRPQPPDPRTRRSQHSSTTSHACSSATARSWSENCDAVASPTPTFTRCFESKNIPRPVRGPLRDLR